MSRSSLTQEQLAARRAYDKNYAASHHDQKVAYRLAHHEQRVLYNHTYNAEHPEKRTTWESSHREKRIEYRAARSEETADYDAMWRKANPEKRTLYNAKRRALAYGNTPISELLTEAQWRDILDQYGRRCAYCGRKVEKLTIDHVIPLAKGGKHSANNVVPACVSCNCKKNAKTSEEWVGMAVLNA
jgi:5-methylcytosine-specific restriction endonuclease McrA